VAYLINLSRLDENTDDSLVRSYAKTCYGHLVSNEAQPDFLSHGYYNKLNNATPIKICLQTTEFGFGGLKAGQYVEVDPYNEILMEELITEYLILLATFLRECNHNNLRQLITQT
jgi:hypothetical protein